MTIIGPTAEFNGELTTTEDLVVRDVPRDIAGP
jgi:hypothetical protein